MMRTDDRNAHGSGGGKPGPGADSSVPAGIKILAVLGTVGSVFSGVAGLALIRYGMAGLVLGLLVFGIALAHVYVLGALVNLESWAYPWALGMEGAGVVATGLVGHWVVTGIGLVTLLYLVARIDLYREPGRVFPRPIPARFTSEKA